MKTTSTNNCHDLTKNSFKNLARGTRMFLMLLLLVVGSQFYANAQQGLPAANITGPLVVCVNDPNPQPLTITVSSDYPLTGITFNLTVTSLPAPPDPSACNAYLDAANIAAINVAGPAAWTYTGGVGGYDYILNLPLNFYGGTNVGAFVIDIVVTNTIGPNTASKSVTIIKQQINVSNTPILCYGGNSTITAIATPVGPSFTYTYNIIPAIQPANGTGVFVVPAGTYTISAQRNIGGVLTNLKPGSCEGDTTITITQPPNNPVVLHCPLDESHSACEYANQAALDAAFNTWLTSFYYTGGTNPVLTRTPSIPTAPQLCSGGTTTVTWSVAEDCAQPVSCTRTFTVNPPPAVNPYKPNDFLASACDYADQAALDAAFAAWLTGFGVNGGCNPSGSVDELLSAPALCTGGSVLVTYTYSDLCTLTASVSATFTITAPPALVINKPNDYSESACIFTDQAAVNAAFTSWLTGFTKSGGCNPTASYGQPVPPVLCVGGTTTVTYTYSDICTPSAFVSATFTVIAPPALVINKPNDYSESACIFADQAAVNAAFNSWLTGFTKSGGCNPTATFGQPVPPVLCVGGTTTVTYTYNDLCTPSASVSATFTVIAPPALVINKPNDYSESACIFADQAAVNTAFNSWLTGFTKSGGCNPTATYGQPVPPVLCVGGTTTVTYTYSDLCTPNASVSATFTINAPPAVNPYKPNDFLASACDYADQAAIDAAFATWLTGFGVNGGCNPSGSVDELLSAPALCTGGSVLVTYTYSDLCTPTASMSATFTITAPPALVINKPNDYSESACIFADQAAVNAAFTSWLTGFTKSGGCNPTGSYGQPVPPVLCVGGTTTVTYTYSDLCTPSASVSATFTVIAPPALVVNPPANFLAPAATYPNQAAADAAFALWLTGFSVSGGCAPSFNHGNEMAPYYCGGSTEVTWTVTDKCYNSTTHTATFAISAPSTVNVNPVSDLTTPASLYVDQAAADAAFALWLSGFSVSGGINPQFTIIGSPVAPYYCGGSIEVTWEVTDFCYNTTLHKATFTITPPPPVVVTEVLDKTVLACTYADQAAADAAFAAWKGGFSVSGGINPQYTIIGSPVAPSFCGGSTIVTWEVSDRCYNTKTYLATFTITAPSAVIPTKPNDYSKSACFFADQAAIDNAFAMFIGQFGVSGGCNPSGSVDELLSAPTLCTGGSVIVTYYWSDLCSSGQEVATFTITAPPAVIATAPQDYSNSACALGSQAAVDAAFVTFLAGFTVNGGCNPSGSYDELLSAPALCTGGSVMVTYNWSDLCDNGTKVATFTITPAQVTLNCGNDFLIPACPTQTALNAAWNSFKLSVTASGGCNGSLTNDAPLCPPDKCGGSKTVTWTYTSSCGTRTCTKTFTVDPAPPVSFVCGNDVNLPACSDQATIDQAWTNFLNSTTASGGCNGVLTNNATSPPGICGGHRHVTWTYTSDCDNGQKCTGHTCTKTFTVASAPPVVMNCGNNVTIPACPTQGALNAAWDSFKLSVTASGGCNGQLTNNAQNPPDICGGCVYVKWTYTSDCDCYSPRTCIKKFTVLPAPPVVFSCGNNKTVAACSDQATIDQAWTNFLNSTTATGGCGGVMTNNATNPPDKCLGGSVDVTWTYTSLCDNGQKCTGNTCTRTFKVLPAPPVVFKCGDNKIVPSCSSQSAINTAWNCFLNSTTASGGCNGSLTHNAANPPDKCLGGSVDVTWTYTSDCDVTRTCTRTFTVNPAPPIVFICGDDVLIPACPTQSALNAAWTSFKSSVTASGGCNGSLTNDAPLCPPDKCGGSKTVTWTYTSSCGTRTCTKTFTVDPAPPVVFDCPDDVIVPACSSIGDIQTAWNNFLNSIIASGGCNGVLTNNATNPPGICGGHRHVTWTYTTECDNGQKCTGHTCTKTFTVASPPPVEIICGNDVIIPSCPTQSALTAAWDSFKLSVTANGGCNGELTNNAQNPPDICGGCVYVKWTYTSDCAAPIYCTKKFTVLPAPEVVLDCGDDVTLPACSDQATIDLAWANFLTSTTATGGCGGVMTHNGTNPPDKCGGSVDVTWTYNSLCNNGQKCTGNTCTRTFKVLPAPNVDFKCGAHKTISACPDQTVITTAWNNFLNSTTASGGCNGSLTNNATNPPDKCGGNVDVTWTYTSDCDGPHTCTRTFTIDPAPPVDLNCGNNVLILACPGPSALNAAYIAFKSQANASGGCDGILSTIAPLCPPDICGGSVDVTWNYTSSCGEPATCTRTLTVNPAPPVVFTCGSDVTVPACTNQATLNQAWTDFLNSTTASGGCNGNLVHNAPPNFPNPCGDLVYVTWTYHTPCDDGQTVPGYTCTRTFKVESPTIPLNVTKPGDYTALSSNFANQAAVATAFQNWLSGFTISGGCAPTATYGTPSAPNLNTGGTTTVTYNFTDVCTDASFLTAKFTINLSSSIANPTTSTDPWTPTLDPMNIDLTIAPNPFTDQTNINFTLSEDSKVSVEIFNITGAKIATIYEGQVFANEPNTFKYVPELRGNQVLLCIIRTPNGIAEKRMVLVR